MQTCPICQAPYDTPFSKCPDCLEMIYAPQREAARQIAEQEARTARAVAWKTLCPPEYNQTDWSRPHLSPICCRLAKEWWPNWAVEECGLGIWGSTGRGKTRAMYAILRRLHFAGIGCLPVEATTFARAASTWNDDDRALRYASRALLNRCQNIRVLYLDDIGKEPATRTVAAALHELLEARCQRRLPTLFTSERTGEELSINFGAHYADGIIRRLRGTCQIHEATPAPQPA